MLDLELTVLRGVLHSFGALYWLLAAGAVVLALTKGRSARRRAAWMTLAVAVFAIWPGAKYVEMYRHAVYERAAWAYFKKKCETEAGEKIYKTFTGVKSVLVIKPLPPATEKDNFDQFWYGDPYSASAAIDRANNAAIRLVMDWKNRAGSGVQEGLEFVEIRNGDENSFTQFVRSEFRGKAVTKRETVSPASKLGIAWEDISTPKDRHYWVAGSRLRVVDLSDNTTVAERIGFLIEPGFGSTSGSRRPWLTARGVGPNGCSCPDAHDATDQWFLNRVFDREAVQ